MVATWVSLDDQLTDPDTLPVCPSEYVPVAVNVTGLPFGVDNASGLTLMLVRAAEVTVRLAAGAVIPLTDAVILVLPTAMPVAIPVVLPIVAIDILADVHVTWPVMSAVVASV